MIKARVYHICEPGDGLLVSIMGLTWQVVQALQFVKAAYRSRNTSFDGSSLPMMRLQGTPDTWVDISWQKTISVAYLAFRVIILLSMHALRLHTLRHARLSLQPCTLCSSVTRTLPGPCPQSAWGSCTCQALCRLQTLWHMQFDEAWWLETIQPGHYLSRSTYNSSKSLDLDLPKLRSLII